jgi:hypothetical protein
VPGSPIPDDAVKVLVIVRGVFLAASAGDAPTSNGIASRATSAMPKIRLIMNTLLCNPVAANRRAPDLTVGLAGPIRRFPG